MPPYKRQHFLPTAYLRYFSSDQNACFRDSCLWRFDGKSSRHVPVVSQCFGDYFYSKSQPETVEKMFEKGERVYCKCVDRVREGNSLSGAERGDLLVLMFDFFVRNNVHKNLTNQEGIKAYNTRFRLFLEQILLGKKAGSVTKAEIARHIENNWLLELFALPPGKQLITSDSPSAWASLDRRKPGLHMVMLPLTPFCIAIAVDKRVARFTSQKLNQNDLELINCAQIQCADCCIFSAERLDEVTTANINRIWSKISQNLCVLNGNTWRLSLQALIPGWSYSFIQVAPPPSWWALIPPPPKRLGGP